MQQMLLKSLKELFEAHRIVFWYDNEKNMRAEFDNIALDGVEKAEIANNEFSLKYRILRQQSRQKFLLYHAGPQPEDADNWLLDILVAQAELRTDDKARWLAELGLTREYLDFITAYPGFFKDIRPAALKAKPKPGDSREAIELKMLAVVAQSEPALQTITEELIKQYTKDGGKIESILKHAGLWELLLRHLKENSGYDPAGLSSLKDFLLDNFQKSWEATPESSPSFFFSAWKKNGEYTQDFRYFSRRFSKDLSIAQQVGQKDITELENKDEFREIDEHLVALLIRQVTGEAISHGEFSRIHDKRKLSVWYEDFVMAYKALEAASAFFQAFRLVKLDFPSITDGIANYTTTYYKIDQLYRNYSCFTQQSGLAQRFQELTAKIDNFYINQFLYPLAGHFYENLPPLWEINGYTRQDAFYNTYIKSFLNHGNKVCVIISDSLRYEIGEELCRALENVDRYQGDIKPLFFTRVNQ